MRSRRHLAASVVVLTGAALLGLPATPAGAAVPTPTNPHTLATGYGFTVTIGGDGQVYGTGSNADGQLTVADLNVYTLTRLSGLPGGVTAVSLAAGNLDTPSPNTFGGFTLVLASDGRLYGAGDNSESQLAAPGPDLATLTPLAALPDGRQVVDVTAGNGFTVVVASDGSVWGRGQNTNSQLAAGTADQTSWVQLSLPGVTARAASAGPQSVLVLGGDGQAYGQGSNDDGQLTGAPATYASLHQLSGLPAGVSATEVSTAGPVSLVLGNDGKAYGTGTSNSSQLGTAGSVTTLTELGFPGAPATQRVRHVLATYANTLFLVTSGPGAAAQVEGQGPNNAGQLGDQVGTTRTVPTVVPGPTDLIGATELAGGQTPRWSGAAAAPSTAWAPPARAS